jgi:ATP-dependent exoDNAse (exonuclease V) alpha subunit
VVVPAAIGSATILSVRAVIAQEAPEKLRTALLAGGSGRDDNNRPLVEIIVRVDGGGVLSIVQQNDAGFREGDRVVIMRGDRTRLARPG